MKKLIALLLVAVMCVSLAACGDGELPNTGDNNETLGNNSATNGTGSDTSNNNNNNTVGDANNNNTESNAPNYTEILCGKIWNLLNYKYDFYSLGFNEDGTCEYYNAKWELSDNIVKITSDEDTSNAFNEYSIVESNGIYFLVSDCYVYYLGDRSSLPIKKVEITSENWNEYFEIITDTIEEYDQFGEKTNEYTRNYFSLKKEYVNSFFPYDSELLIRFSGSGDSEIDERCDGIWIETTDMPGYGCDVRNADATSFGVVKIEGTLAFVEGI